MQIQNMKHDVQEVSDGESNSESFLPENVPKMAIAETMGRIQDEVYLSSSESTKTLCESEKGAFTRTVIAHDHIEESLERVVEAGSPAVVNIKIDVEHVTDETLSALEPELKQEGSGDGVNRPDSLQGLQMFQRSQSNFTGLGLAFPSQNGSLVGGHLPSVVGMNLIPEEWESFGFSPLYERPYKQTDSTPDRYNCAHKLTKMILF